MIKHGHTKERWKSPTYNSWVGLKDRCTNPNNPKYYLYGGKGITFQDEWEDFSNFLLDMGEKPIGTSLDRIDGNKGYFKGNCRWATIHQQNRNITSNKFITYKGVTKTNQEWANELGFPPSTLYNRVFTRGWDVEKAFTTPIRFKRK